MEWVETTGKTVEEAKELALDQLGVHEEDAEFDVLEEPKAGLFGRVRGEARVRARVRPAPVRQKVDRRDRRRDKADKGDNAGQTDKAVADGADVADRPVKAAKKAAAAQSDRPARPAKSAKSPAASGARAAKPSPKPAASADSEGSHDNKEHTVDARQVGEEAQRFMNGLVEAFGLSGTVELVEDGDDLEVRVHGQELGLLVGPRGTTLQAVQDVVRVASQRRLGDHDTRLRVDVGGYRERRRVALGQFALKMAEEVTASGVARVLEPMSSADRKIVHDSLSGVDGIATRSEGEDPQRRVIIAPAND
ncbi:MAG: RNA-binding cell elongation regulator Jag/EloR [Actinomycetota bacterium]